MVQIIKSKAELDEAVKKAENKLVVIDFYATWCGPCKVIAPVLEKLGEDMKDKLVVLKIDVDEEKCTELCEKYSVTSMPTFVFIKAGAEVDKFAGANESKLKETINKHIS